MPQVGTACSAPQHRGQHASPYMTKLASQQGSAAWPTIDSCVATKPTTTDPSSQQRTSLLTAEIALFDPPLLCRISQHRLHLQGLQASRLSLPTSHCLALSWPFVCTTSQPCTPGFFTVKQAHPLRQGRSTYDMPLTGATHSEEPKGFHMTIRGQYCDARCLAGWYAWKEQHRDAAHTPCSLLSRRPGPGFKRYSCSAPAAY